MRRNMDNGLQPFLSSSLFGLLSSGLRINHTLICYLQRAVSRPSESGICCHLFFSVSSWVGMELDIALVGTSQSLLSSPPLPFGPLAAAVSPFCVETSNTSLPLPVRPDFGNPRRAHLCRSLNFFVNLPHGLLRFNPVSVCHSLQRDPRPRTGSSGDIETLTPSTSRV
ncbi:hypothetical protein VTJ04DRAFT_7883 [Mycothermus thermophilus]|uniref:uncharacterized protein n=1 Tax=Humicola insolens TaxID=85995 RepID=UPI003742CD71